MRLFNFCSSNLPVDSARPACEKPWEKCNFHDHSAKRAGKADCGKARDCRW